MATPDRTTKTDHTELHMWREIHRQPDVAALNLGDEGGRLERAARWIAEQDPKRLHFAGCGDSRFTGMVGRYAMSRWAGMPTTVHQSFDALAYLMEEMSGGILLAYSNSGESQTTVDCAEAAATRGVPVLAVTGHEGSRLARLADHVLVTNLPEAPVAASHTTSHTAMIATTLGLAARVAALRSRDTTSIDRAIASAPAAMRDTLEMAGPEARRVAMRHRSRDRWVLLGAGPPSRNRSHRGGQALRDRIRTGHLRGARGVRPRADVRARTGRSGAGGDITRGVAPEGGGDRRWCLRPGWRSGHRHGTRGFGCRRPPSPPGSAAGRACGGGSPR